MNDEVFRLSTRLRSEGIDVALDQYEQSPNEGWQRWMEKQIDKSDFVLVLCTRRLQEKHSPESNEEDVELAGKGVRWEMSFMDDYLYNSCDHTKFIPIAFKKADLHFVPLPLRKATHYVLGTDEGYKLLYRRLTGQPERLKPPLGGLVSMPPIEDTRVVLEPLPARERRQGFVDRLELIKDFSDPVIGFVGQTTNISDGKLVDQPKAWIRLEEAFLGAFKQSMRFLIRFYGEPTGVRMAVRNRVASNSNGSPIEMFRIEDADESGNGGEMVVGKGGIWEVPFENGSGRVVYEIVYTSGLELARLEVPLIFGWSADDLPSSGSIKVTATQCPISGEVPVPVGSYPDFGFDRQTILFLSNGMTALLFPYVSNQFGFDTGIAVSNTSSASPFKPLPQRGRCTFIFHGDCGDGVRPDVQCSEVVEAGEQVTFTLSQGNAVWGINPIPKFQGFIVALCEFQPAHGFAMLTEATSAVPNFAQGYLAEVIDRQPDLDSKAATGKSP